MIIKSSVFFSIFLFLIFSPSFISSYKILVMIMTPSTSHFNQGKAIANILHEKGHNVTFISAYPSKNLPYRSIVIPEAAGDDLVIDIEDESKQSYFNRMMFVALTREFSKMTINNAFSSETFKNFIKNKEENFDLMIMDYVYNDIYFGLSVRYGCPAIALSASPFIHWLAKATGNSISPATIPDVFLDFSNEMSLRERAINVMCIFVQELFGYFTFSDMHEEDYKKYFPEEAKRVKYQDLMKQISLVFANTYPALNYPRPLLPNVVEIGGFHVKEPEPLTKEYKDILDNAKNGVIFFSLGSYLKTHTLPKHIRDVLLKSLSKLKETVLWKFETELEGLPKNVIIKKWMPQPGILAHPNVKLFITHGGILSITEATLAGKPLVAIPVFADQYYNARIVEEAKTGKTLTFEKLTEESFDNILQEVLNNQTYVENARNLKTLYLDRPMTPQDTVNFYAEYVIRNKGAKHLTPPYVDTFTFLLLDIIAILLVTFSAIFGFVFYVCKRLSRSEEKTKKHKKQ